MQRLISELLTVAPGFTRGLEFEHDGCTIKSGSTQGSARPKVVPASGVVNLMDLLQQEHEIFGKLRPLVF